MSLLGLIFVILEDAFGTAALCPFQNTDRSCLGSCLVPFSLYRYLRLIAVPQDAIDTAAESGDTSLAEDLLSFFVNIGDKECFCAALYTCYSLIRPDVAMELAWRNK